MAIFKTDSELIWGSRGNGRFCERHRPALTASLAPLMHCRGHRATTVQQVAQRPRGAAVAGVWPGSAVETT